MARFPGGLVGAFLALTACVAAPEPPQGGTPLTIAPGEVSRAVTVYWIRRNPCSSRLNSVTGASIASGDTEGIEVGIRREAAVTPWQCPNLTVPGAIITLRQTRPFTTAETRNLSLVVSYDTMDGPQTSRHLVQVNLVPAAPAQRP